MVLSVSRDLREVAEQRGEGYGTRMAPLRTPECAFTLLSGREPKERITAASLCTHNLGAANTALCKIPDNGFEHIATWDCASPTYNLSAILSGIVQLKVHTST